MTDPSNERTLIPPHLADLTVDLTVRIGTGLLNLDQLSKLSAGSLIELREGIDRPLDLCANGHVIARGELEEAEGGDTLSLRITETLGTSRP